MLPPSIATLTVQILRAPRIDDHGTSAPDWTQDPVETDVENCSFQPGPGGESVDHRLAALGVAQLWMPDFPDVTPLDRIRARGDVYEVVGRPQRWDSPSGSLDHTLLTLKVWEG